LTGTVKDKKAAVIMAVFFSILLFIVGNVQAQELATLDREISQVIDRIAGAVATVEARPQPSRAPIFPDQSRIFSRPVKAVVGSGLLIDSVGHILTSLRLVDGYDDFSVEIDGQTMAASLVGFDRRHHLAVLKVDSIFHSYLDVSPFPPVTGRLALAYGHAIDHTGYPALGIIAGRQTDGSYLVSGTVLPGLLGGGIFDLRGKLIGVISSGNVVVNDYSGT
jgi:S1-C subfamily serine protease